jgi:hypothetical protein
MTPKEKAKELVKRFEDGLTIKDCALIAVDECIELLLNISPHMAFPQQVEYWQEIKHELDKL